MVDHPNLVRELGAALFIKNVARDDEQKETWAHKIGGMCLPQAY